MAYFSISEFVRSGAATAAGINNSAPPEAVQNILLLIENVLDPVRDMWGKPIFVNSGYRSAALNKLVGGAKNSAHLTGEAADITAGNSTLNKALFALCEKAVKTGNLVVDQLIDEKDYQWLHLSYRASGDNRGQILHLS
jgi:hypothetical protein